jgi:hypothetical protein
MTLSEGMLCISWGISDPSGYSVFNAHVFVVQTGHLSEVLAQPIGTGPMFIEGCRHPCQQPFDVRLNLRVEEEGRRLILFEDPKHRCYASLAGLAEKTARSLNKYHQIVCGSAGTYVWEGQRYVRH